ncbi:SDR family oxidoreductase [Gordonia sp. HNM0687]|uniref:SDR family oxidoreductase n=1 Tax=Gordonia mangrovi TaxID=2665643 RepID=A0A6L7GTP5_9ACTN|nr:SDR family oxidoreductase [Gordonia mangrovi]MXP23394.1 SDR family oxidoreductase [Gordonia mangrovi]UVF76703.1 SDR family oxidoreductase [Gordonia mangrovi]
MTPRDHSLTPGRRRFQGKTALIIGGTGVMGSTFCRALAAEGADLVIGARNSYRLRTLADELRDEYGIRVAAVSADLSRPEEAERLADQAWQALGKLDVVVCSAFPGNAAAASGDILSTPDDVWQAFYEVIVWGPLRVMRKLAPLMKSAGGGSFISLISSTGLAPIPGHDAYGLAKGTLLLLTQYMAKEWGPFNIRANSINPGVIATDEDHDSMAEYARQSGILQRTSLNRLGRMDEVVGAML